MLDPSNRLPEFSQCEISQNEAAAYVIDILIGKLAPRQSKSGRWHLDLGSVAIECNELPNYDTEELARLAIAALEDLDKELDGQPNRRRRA